ncbi:DUF4747 family protein [Chthonobacter rhizosphaerae]|uniref:DUF4747 family protein n=1 Tax=Chthonobacter rhizosphaerae TaxID=2735553 RepID=UPI0015EF4755|nr:DUF4747 family protein [Chthonobacter rhizosphaerae]
MARTIKMAVSILNVRLHPHSPSIYAEYIKDLHQRRLPVRIHGDRYAMLSMLDTSNASDGTFFGAVTAFTRIDKNGSWFDADKLEEATENQISRLSIPENLYPNSASFYFLFDTKKHRIYIQQYTKGRQFTPASALRLFEGLSDNLDITAKYNLATITIVQSAEGLAQLFSVAKINEVKITILKPNSDIFEDDFEAKIEAHLHETHSRSLVLTYDAEPGQSIVINEGIKNVTQVALENGGVEIKGRDETGAVYRSTNEYPKLLQDRYDPNVMSEENAFRRIVAKDG